MNTIDLLYADVSGSIRCVFGLTIMICKIFQSTQHLRSIFLHTITGSGNDISALALLHHFLRTICNIKGEKLVDWSVFFLESIFTIYFLSHNCGRGIDLNT